MTKRRTHRELMTEPGYPKRRMKRESGETASGFAMYMAYQMGYGAAGGMGSIDRSLLPRRWQSNPYKPGTHRHAEYDRGRDAYHRDEGERHAERHWRV